MITEIVPNIYKINVVLPENPLKNLNCYVVKGAERNLIIDTGFNREECLESLKEGIKELDLDMNVTDVFVTHVHADHSGLVPEIITEGSKVYMNPIDKDILNRLVNESASYWSLLEERYVQEGFPEEVIKKSLHNNPARKFVPRYAFESIPVEEGSKLCYGNYEFTCIVTPGHTPGHTCLYCEKEQLMFTGDHVLFGITPNITLWRELPSSLHSYIDSLRKIKESEVKLALVGHREITGEFHNRVEEILIHHENRLSDAYTIIDKYPGIDGYELASKMKWSIRAKDWDDFPANQKWFAVGETIAHLNYLVIENKIYKEVEDGINKYYIV